MANETWITLGHIGLVLLLGLFGLFLIQQALRVFEKRAGQAHKTSTRRKHLATVVRAVRNAGYAALLSVIILMILNEFGVNITPILASAGVVGLAVSLGAQTLIKDFLGGMLILAESQFSIGDVVTIGAVTGTVEDITLRVTYLRDGDGKLTLIPNGDIRQVTNLTTQLPPAAVVTFNLDYDADLERALSLLEEAARRVKEDETTGADLLEAPQVVGWDGFSDWAVQMTISAKTQPGKQLSTARALRKTALELLQKEGIRAAIPRQRIETDARAGTE